MTVEIHPESRPSSELSPSVQTDRPVFVMPPDKSILHRILIIGALTRSAIRIPISSPQAISHDVIATILALESLGVPVEMMDDAIELQGVGLHGLRAATHKIDCANSGTTARLLMGLLAPQPFTTVLLGDASLRKRPMKRLSDLLEGEMGARIETTPEGTLPVVIEGRALTAGHIRLRTASAQMKSAILIAGLYTDGETTVEEPGQSRDHTERILEAFGVDVSRDDDVVTLRPSQFGELPAEFEYFVPGDISSAAFLIAAAILLRRRVEIQNVLLNPTRTRFLDMLTLMGVDVEIGDIVSLWGEDRGTLVIDGDKILELHSIEIEDRDIVMLIDELPILSMLMAFANGRSKVRGALELRRKESDRIAVMIAQFRRFGIRCAEYDDGFEIDGDPKRVTPSVQIEHLGDHRMAMAFAVAALRAAEPIVIPDAEAVNVSYPDFFTHIAVLAGADRLRTSKDHADA